MIDTYLYVNDFYSFYILAELKSNSQAGNKKEQASKPKEQTTKQSPPNHVSAHAVIHHGMVGVASISGVDSRNGRLSSISGFKFYPPIDSSMVKKDSKGNSIFKTVDGKMQMPITITKQGEGVSGTIRIMPGSVSVSSSSNSGSASASAGPQMANFDSWSNPFMKPMMNDLFFPDPFPAFPSISNSAYHTRIPDSTFRRIPEPSFPRIPEPSFQSRMPDPWMEKDMFKHMLPRHNMLRNDWFYPSFSPFINYW